MNNKTVLIVEDDVSLLKLLQTKLGEQLEASVLVARDGESGLATALQNKPNLIVLDLIMPRLDGVAMMERLRQDAWGKTARVLVLTNVDQNEKVARCLELGAEEYLVKTDWKLKDLIAEIVSKNT